MGFRNWADEDKLPLTAIDWKARALAAETELAALKAAQFTITLERLSKVYDSLYEYYTQYGYSAWAYWRTTDGCAAVFGELLETALSEMNPMAWDKVWEEWLITREEAETETPQE